MHKIRYTELADTDLFDIYVYTYQTWGASQAISYTAGLKSAIDRIAQEPTRPGTIDRSNLRQGYRSYHQQRHLIFYRVVENTIEIIRVLHDSMDIANRLSAVDQDNDE
ncbi:plasmid stabilization system protein [Leptolyngbya sp. PCC 7375]|nr:plasmid stabilization system protein [Leptolyngbya sp. PCC 7375]